MQHARLLMLFGLEYLFRCQEKELLQKNLKIILLLFDQENSVHSVEKKKYLAPFLSVKSKT